MRLFISYAHADREDVEALARVLDRGGFEAWYDYELVPGEVWHDRLAAEIAGCEAFVYALTPESINSEYCQWEFQKALALHKPVMPVLLKAGTEHLPAFPTMLRDRQWADLTHGLTPENTAHLLNGLHRMQALLHASPLPYSAEESAEFIAPGAGEDSMSKSQDDDKPRISISQKADHSSNVTQIGYTAGNVNITSGGVSETLAPELQRLYDRLDQWIAAQTNPADREDATDATARLTTSIKQADEGGLRRALRTLKGMAPDIWEVVVATLSNPIAGVNTVIQKVAARAKKEASG
jgi:hypothetical protein